MNGQSHTNKHTHSHYRTLVLSYPRTLNHFVTSFSEVA